MSNFSVFLVSLQMESDSEEHDHDSIKWNWAAIVFFRRGCAYLVSELYQINKQFVPKWELLSLV